MNKYHLSYNRAVDSIIEKKGKSVLFRQIDEKKQDVIFRYSEIKARIEKTRDLMKQTGITPGCRVAVISEHSPFALFTDLVLAYIGVKAVLIDAGLPAEDIRKLCADADVSGLIVSKSKLSVVSDEEMKDVPVFQMEADYSFSHMPDSLQKAKHIYPRSDDDVIAIIFSSGTTGITKGVEVTYRSILYTTKWCRDYDIVTSETRHLNVIPANHIAGYSTGTACILLGSEMGFISEVSSSALLYALQSFDPRNFIMIPKVYEVMMEKIKGELAKQKAPVRAYAKFAMKTCSVVRKATGYKLRFLTKPIWKKAFGRNMLIVGSGTAPCKQEIVEFYLDLGMNFMDVYGSTECGVPITSTNVFEKYPLYGSGKITELPYVKIRIADPDNEGVGEVRIKSKLMMKGYFKDPELTKAAFDAEGYFCTGDLGFVDKQKNLHIIGRIKESIVLKNGKKVSPAEVDERYRPVCGEINIAACGIPNSDGTDEIHLFMEHEGHSDQEILLAINAVRSISDKESVYRRLNGIHVVDKLPTTSIGKVKRYLLKDMIGNTVKNTELIPEEAVSDKLLAILHKYVPDSAEIRSSDKLINDLNMDSLALFSLCADVQEQYGTDITNKMTNDLTVSGLEYLIGSDGSNTSVAYDIKQYPLEKTAADIWLLKQFADLSSRKWDMKFYGLENIPANGGFILCPNHESHLDTMWIVSALYLNGIDVISRCSCMGAEYVMNSKILGKGFRALGGIPVDRTGNPAPALKRAEEYISEHSDTVFMIHPEGTRTRDGRLGKFKNGAAALALGTNTPIIPVCINGAREIFPPDRKLPRLTGKMPLEIHFGRPIDPAQKTPDEITGEIRSFIVQCKKRRNHHD